MSPPPDDQEAALPTDSSKADITARVDERLRGLDDAPIDEHAAIYDAVHHDLADALGPTGS